MGVPGLWDAIDPFSTRATIRQLVLARCQTHGPASRLRVGVDMGMVIWVSDNNGIN